MIRKIIIGCLLLVIGLIAGGALPLWQEIDLSSDGKIFEVQPGESFNSVGQRLKLEGLSPSPLALKVYARLTGADSQIRVGEYLLQPPLSSVGILRVLSTGQSLQRKFTIPEGANIYEIAEVFEAKGLSQKDEFLKIVKNQGFVQALLGEEYVKNHQVRSLEGYLFPETYSYTKYSTPKEILKQMVSNFNRVFKTLKEVEGGSLSRHQVVILASVVEKETGAPEERPQIASVFHNRLKKKMKLQSDPTIIYGLWEIRGERVKNIRKKDILSKTPFNTYVVKALPVGPIANPGKESLQAVLTPAVTNKFYFVSRNDGTHVFTETYDMHLKAVRAYQLNRKARKGKSWRDLKKREE